jgi:hypothetical protein
MDSETEAVVVTCILIEEEEEDKKRSREEKKKKVLLGSQYQQEKVSIRRVHHTISGSAGGWCKMFPVPSNESRKIRSSSASTCTGFNEGKHSF